MAGVARLGRIGLLLALVALVFGCARSQSPDGKGKVVATYSIVAYDPATGDFGVAVQSKFFGVGSVVPWARAGIGAIATQSYANTTYGPEGLVALEKGTDPQAVLKSLTGRDSDRALRQVGIVGTNGAAAFTGDRCNPWAGHVVGSHFCAQGNLLASGQVVTNMARAFETGRDSKEGELADWLIAALDAAEEAGGDKRGRQSAALLVVRQDGGYGRFNDRYVDLRVEDHPEPLKELRRLLIGYRKFYRR